MPDRALVVRTWAVGYDFSTGMSVLKFEWIDRDPITLAMPEQQARELAQAILNRTPPASADRQSPSA